MKKHLGMFVLALLVVAALLTGTVGYKVDITEYALVKTFGKTTSAVDGRTEAGLKFKLPWPIQKLIRYDARTAVFEDISSEVPTLDKQNMLVTMYCAWRIADPVKFNATIATPAAAQDSLRNFLRSAKSDVVGKHNMEDFINTDPAKMKIPEIEGQILASVRANAAAYGIDVQGVGIKSLAMPKDVTSVVIDAMKEERQRDVRKYESAGEAQATAIRERARSASAQIQEFARRKAAEIESEGVQAAAQYYVDFSKNERFAMFLRTLESLKKELEARTSILLDGSELPGINFFRTGPSLKPFETPPDKGPEPTKSK